MTDRYQEIRQALEMESTPGASFIAACNPDTIRALLEELDALREAVTSRQSSHAAGCWAWGPKHYECAVRKIKELQEALEALKAENDRRNNDTYSRHPL